MPVVAAGEGVLQPLSTRVVLCKSSVMHSTRSVGITSRGITLLMLFACQAAWAMEPAYLTEMPSAERVIADTQGKNELDTKARQVAALTQARKAIEDLGIARIRTGYLPDEQRLIGEYWTAVYRLQDEAKVLTGSAPGADSPWAKWMALQGRYERDAEFRAENLTRYLSPELRTQLNITNANTDARVRESRRQIREDSGVPMSAWESMDEDRQQLAIGFTLIAGLLFLLIGMRELRRFGLLQSDPLVLQAGFRRYALHHFTGTVTNYTRWIEASTTTTTTTDSRGSTSTNVSRSEVEWESFSLISSAGLHDVRIAGAKVYVENGSLVSAVWAIPRRKEKGDYIVFLDRTTQRTRPDRYVLQRMMQLTTWLMVPVLLLAYIVSSSTDLWLGMLPRTSGMLRGALGVMTAWVVMLGIRGIVGRIRASRFVRRDAARLQAAIDAAEDGAAMPARG